MRLLGAYKVVVGLCSKFTRLFVGCRKLIIYSCCYSEQN